MTPRAVPPRRTATWRRRCSMARKRASMREGPLAELFRATEAAQRQQDQGEQAPPAEPAPPPAPEPEPELPPAAAAPPPPAPTAPPVESEPQSLRPEVSETQPESARWIEP